MHMLITLWSNALPSAYKRCSVIEVINVNGVLRAAVSIAVILAIAFVLMPPCNAESSEISVQVTIGPVIHIDQNGLVRSNVPVIEIQGTETLTYIAR